MKSFSTTTTESPDTTEFEAEDETTTIFPDDALETTTEIDALPDTTTIQTTTTTTRKSGKTRKICHAHGVWKNVAGFDDWCNLNCNHRPPYCPKSHCKCD